MIVPLLLCLWFLGFLLVWRIPLCRKGRPGRPYPPLSVIVPARNEADNLPRLLASLHGQDVPPAEILVVDDGSTDTTAGVAAAAGATVLQSAPLPDGWRGKNWACHQGARAAKGEILLFVDADTFFEPGGLGRALATFHEGEGAMSICAYHVVPRLYEQLSAYFNLMMAAGIGAFTILGSQRPPSGLFGPFLMVDRKAYRRSGGHAAVKEHILENVFMAARFRALGIPMRCYGGEGTFSFRMYPHGLGELIEGWSKASASGANRTPPLRLFAIIAWIGGAIMTAVLLCRSRDLLSSGLFLLYAAQLALMLLRLGSFRPWTALLYPVPLIFYLVIFTRSVFLAALGRNVSWKGRAVPPRRRREGPE